MTTVTRPVGRAALALFSALALALTLLPPGMASADGHDDAVRVALFDFEGDTTEPSEVHPAFEVSAMSLARSSVQFFAGNPGRAMAGTQWHEGDNYFQFEVTPPPEGVEPTAFAFDQNASGTGPEGWAISIVDDLDGDDPVETEIATGGTSTSFGSRDVDLADVGERTERFAVRIRGFDASSSGGTWRIDNVDLTGVTDAEGPDPEPDPECDTPEEEITRIHEVQGDGTASPIVGDTVTIDAVVTLAEPDLGGVFVQEAPENEDGDPATSEGLFLATGSIPEGVEPATTVQATGAIEENFGRTQMATSAGDIAVCDDEPVEIEPVELPLPSAPAERERFENMLVTASDLVVSGSFSAYRFGELITGYQGELPSATEIAAPGEGAEQVQEEVKAREVILDDRSTETLNDRSIWDEDPERRLGDRIDEVTGVLDYTFGNYKIQYTEFPEFELYGAPEVPRLEEGNDIGAFNVLNFFNEFGDSSRLRGARNQEQFDLQSTKIVNTILELDPTVLGLIELQNDYLDEFDGDDGTEPSIATLVDLLNDAAGEERYEYVRVPEDELLVDETALNGGGVGPDAIANGIIYQPERATQVGEGATFDIDAELEGDDRKNRWPVAASFDIDDRVVSVAVNHFKSKGSSCEDVSGPDFDLGEDTGSELTGNCDLTRQYAARQLVDWVEEDPTGAGTDEVFLVGDFNAYAQEAPIRIMEDAGYLNTIERFDDGAFTYKFSGRVGTLDYILASEAATPAVDDAEVWQVNSRASYVDLYYIADQTDTEGPKGASDHDPLVASLLPGDDVTIDPDGARSRLADLVEADAVRPQLAANVERTLDRVERALDAGRVGAAAGQLTGLANQLDGQARAAERARRGPVAEQDADGLRDLAAYLRQIIDELG